MGANGIQWELTGANGGKWGQMEANGGQWGPMESWGPTGANGSNGGANWDQWGPTGANGSKPEPSGSNGGQWGPTGANGGKWRHGKKRMHSSLLLGLYGSCSWVSMALAWGLYGFCSWVSTARYYVFLLFRGSHCKHVLMNMHIYRFL